MAAFTKFLSRFFAILCSILFVVTAIVTLILFNLERRVFDANTYKKALQNQNIYEQMPSILGGLLSSSASFNPCNSNSNPIACGAEARSAEAMACFENALGAETYMALSQNKRAPTEAELKSAQACIDQYNETPDSSNAEGPPAYLNNLTAKDWERIISIILPPAELKSMAEHAFDQMFAYLNGEADSAQLSMLAFKQRLAGPDGTQAVLALMNTQPPCSQEQLDAMTTANPEGGQRLEICSPPADRIADITPLIETQIQGALIGIPDQVTLIRPEAANQNDGTPRKGLGLIRLIMRLSILVPLVFLLGITVFVVRSLVTWLNWWGWPLLIAGTLVSIIGFSSSPLINLFVPRLIARQMPYNAPAVLTQTSGDLAGAVARQIVKPVGWEGLLLAIIGLAMVLVSIYLTRREKNKIAASEAETQTF